MKYVTLKIVVATAPVAFGLMATGAMADQTEGINVEINVDSFAEIHLIDEVAECNVDGTGANQTWPDGVAVFDIFANDAYTITMVPDEVVEGITHYQYHWHIDGAYYEDVEGPTGVAYHEDGSGDPILYRYGLMTRWDEEAGVGVFASDEDAGGVIEFTVDGENEDVHGGRDFYSYTRQMGLDTVVYPESTLQLEDVDDMPKPGTYDGLVNVTIALD